jgi:hypothetical protein
VDIVTVFTAAPLSEVRRFFTTLTGSSDDIESSVADLTLAVLVGLSGVDADFNFFALILVETSELVSESEESEDDEDDEELEPFFFPGADFFSFGVSLSDSDSDDSDEEEEELESFLFFFHADFFCFGASPSDSESDESEEDELEIDAGTGFPNFNFLIIEWKARG